MQAGDDIIELEYADKATTQAFKARVAECEQAELNLKSKLTMTLKEIKVSSSTITGICLFQTSETPHSPPPHPHLKIATQLFESFAEF